MGKVDVIQAIFDSYELIRAHYKEVALPLIFLLILSGAMQLGGRGFSGSSWNDSGRRYSNADSMIANAMGDLSSLMQVFATGLVGIVLVLVICAIIALIAVAILDRAAWFYVYEHFYAILLKRKVKEGWKSGMKRHLVKSVIFLLFWSVIILVLLVAPGIFLFASSFSLASLVILAIGVLLLLALLLVLCPLWVFFAMDGRGIIESAGKSMELVTGNLGAFAVYFFISLLIWAGEGAAVFVSCFCCLSWIVGPVLSIFFGLLLGVALMKIKLALEK